LGLWQAFNIIGTPKDRPVPLAKIAYFVPMWIIIIIVRCSIVSLVNILLAVVFVFIQSGCMVCRCEIVAIFLIL